MLPRAVLQSFVPWLLMGCSLFGDDGARLPADAPAAADILQRSDEAMRSLKSFRAVTRVVPSVPGNPPYENAFDFRGPRCILPAGKVPAVEPNGACPCGPEGLPQDYSPFFDRVKGGRLFGPPYAGGTPAEHLRLERSETLDGRKAWLISYDFQTPSIEGPFTIWRREWIEQDTYIVLRQEQTDDDAFGVRARVTSVLSLFDELPAPPCR
jgi:hypothetical protein